MNNMSISGYMTSSCYPNTANMSGCAPFTGTVYPSSASIYGGGSGWTQVFPSQTAVWPQPEQKKDKDPFEKLMEFMFKEKEERVAREKADREDDRRRQEKVDEMIRKHAEKLQKESDTASEVQRKLMEQLMGREEPRNQDGDVFDAFVEPKKFETWEQLRKGPKEESSVDTTSSIENLLAYKMLIGDEKKKEKNEERLQNEIERLTMMLEQEKQTNAKHRAQDKQYERESDQMRFEMALREQDRLREKTLESEKLSFERFRMELQAKQAKEILDHKYKMKNAIVTGITTFVTAAMILASLAFGMIATKEYDIKTLKLNKGVETSQGK